MWVLGQWRPDKKKNRIIAPPHPSPPRLSESAVLPCFENTHIMRHHTWLASSSFDFDNWMLDCLSGRGILRRFFLSFLSPFLSFPSQTLMNYHMCQRRHSVDCCVWLIAWINKHSSFSVWLFWSYINLRILTSHLSWTQMTACRLVLLVWAPGTCWEINCLCFGFI